MESDQLRTENIKAVLREIEKIAAFGSSYL